MKRACAQVALLTLAVAFSYLTVETGRACAALLKLEWRYIDVTVGMVLAAAWPALLSAAMAAFAWTAVARVSCQG